MGSQVPVSSHAETMRASRRCPGLLNAAVFFSLFGLYVRIAIDPKVVYANFGLLYCFPLFHSGWDFFRSHLTHPGDCTGYVSALLSQGFHNSWLGTIILTLLALSLWAGVRAVICLTGASRTTWVAYLVPIMLLISYNACDHPLASGLALSLAIWLALSAIALAPRSGAQRIIFFVATAALGYWLVGPVVLVTTLLIWIIDCLSRKQNLSGWLALVLGLAVPWAMGSFLFHEVTPEQYLILTPFDLDLELWWLTAMMYLTVILGPLLARLWHQSTARRHNASANRAASKGSTRWRHASANRATFKSPARRRNAPANRATSKSPARWRSSFTDRAAALLSRPSVAWSVRATMLMVVAVVGLAALGDPYKRRFLRMAYHSRQEEWTEVLTLARAMPAQHHDGFTACLVERALYHSGKSGDEWFAYSPWVRRPGSALSKTAQGRCLFFLRAEWMLDLGDVNGAEWQASEALENCGDMPTILEMLARISIAKGYPRTARVYLSAMARDLIAGARGRQLLQSLDQDPTLSSDPEIARLSEVMPTKDFVMSSNKKLELIVELLRQSPGNQTAVDLLLAYCLELGNLDDFVQIFRRFDALVNEPLPRHYAEALMLYANKIGRPLELGKRQLPEGLADRFEQFNRGVTKSARDIVAAKQNLAPEFGDTFWFHYKFREVATVK
jgi:uncharacterized protein DUF6057